MTKSHKHKDENFSKRNKGKQDDGDDKIKATEIKNAHASGIGALGRSEENQLENLSNKEAEKDEDVY